MHTRETPARPIRMTPEQAGQAVALLRRSWIKLPLRGDPLASEIEALLAEVRGAQPD